MSNQNLLRRRVQVVLKLHQRHIVTLSLLGPLEVKLEIVRNILLYIQLVSSQTVRHVHRSLRQLPSFVGILKLVVNVANTIVSMLDHLNQSISTNR